MKNVIQSSSFCSKLQINQLQNIYFMSRLIKCSWHCQGLQQLPRPSFQAFPHSQNSFGYVGHPLKMPKQYHLMKSQPNLHLLLFRDDSVELNIPAHFGDIQSVFQFF
jgi:hypothetical protein